MLCVQLWHEDSVWCDMNYRWEISFVHNPKGGREEQNWDGQISLWIQPFRQAHGDAQTLRPIQVSPAGVRIVRPGISSNPHKLQRSGVRFPDFPINRVSKLPSTNLDAGGIVAEHG